MIARRKNPRPLSSQRILLLFIAVALFAWGAEAAAQQGPAGEMVWAVHVTIPPAWFDPAEAPAQITPFGILYALHDALVRPMPGERMGNSLADAWSESADGLVYEFKLRPGLRFHNGDPFTAEDVRFSFDRYKGAGAKELREKVARVEVVDPLTVRFHLKAVWPDFMTFYGTTATAAGLVVPKNYYEQVGDDGFKKHPIGLGPYKFVSYTPGVGVVLEANEHYWRKVPSIKRITMKGVPEGTTRLAMLKNGEADLASTLQGAVAEEAKRDPQLSIVDTRHPSIFWIEFAEQWDPKSVWADIRVRQAVNYALDRQAINEAACLGYCPPAGVIVPRLMDFALQAEPPAYDPKKAKQLLAEAGYPNGLDAGDFIPSPPFFDVGEAVVNDLNAVGIRLRMRTMERATFLSAWREKKLRGLFMPAVGASGNAATRVEAFIYSKGPYAYGGYPDIDELFERQALERDRGKREALLQQIQQLTVDRAMFAPIMDLRSLFGVGPRFAEHMINSIPLHPYPAYEDMRLKTP
jgi:peptide/nickel transport system substrate-binding protein